jgi:hypothetical protein
MELEAAALARRKKKRSKSYGYEVEMSALASLARIFPKLRRTGSMAYSKAAADLRQDNFDHGDAPPPLRLVVTRDKGRPLLVTMSADDAARLAIKWFGPVVVQVKGREKTWLGGVYDALTKATK